MLINLDALLKSIAGIDRDFVVQTVVESVTSSIREIDISGWFKDRCSIGVVFTSLDVADLDAALEAIREKMHSTLAAALPDHILREIKMTDHVYLEENDPPHAGEPAVPAP